jgi:hypothetical protein
MCAFLLAMTLGAVLAGCTTTSQFMKTKSQSARTDVFREIGGKEAIPKGYADLEISASIKTHVERFYPLESKNSLHGKKGYPFVLNIDGQAVIWKDDGEEEIAPVYHENGGRDPEGGAGIRYDIRKKIRLASRKHKVFFGLPGEGYYREFEVVLEEGKAYSLSFEPVYRKDNARHLRERRFINGIEGYKKTLREGSSKPKFKYSQKSGCSRERYRNAPYSPPDGPTPIGIANPGTT